MSRILFLENDLGLINGLIFTFKKQGHEADIVRTLDGTEKIWSGGKYDLLIPDVSLPDGSGFDFCEMVRQVSRAPITFLIAPDEETSIIMGLDMGGDDYIMKPFKLGVLISRINALLRRVKDSGTADTGLQSNGIRVLPLQGQVYKNEERLESTAAECKLLRFFMQNPNTMLSKEEILDKLWDYEGNYIDNNTLTVYICWSHTKVKDNSGESRMIVTAQRMGYKWNVVWRGIPRSYL